MSSPGLSTPIGLTSATLAATCPAPPEDSCNRSYHAQFIWPPVLFSYTLQWLRCRITAMALWN